jgi:Mg-chelatase subunit ChlD
MDKRGRLWTYLVVLFIVVGLSFFLYPKDFDSCLCYGIPSQSCYGFLTGCIEEQVAEPVKVQQGSLVILAIDRSKSMEGSRLAEAIAAGESFTAGMASGDRMAIIAFDDSAELLSGFTADRSALAESIKNITPGNETDYMPAIGLALDLFENATEASNRKFVLLSDGMTKGDIGSLYDMTYALTGQGICLYSIGYGKDADEAESVLKTMTNISIGRSACGSYFQSDEDRIALHEIFASIYEDELDQELKIELLSPTGEVSDPVSISISTNVRSVCTYSLDHGNRMLARQNMTVYTPAGRHTIAIECRKMFGDNEKKRITREFYVKGSVLSRIKRPRQESVPQLEQDEVEYLLDEIIENQKLDIERRISRLGDGTVVNVFIRNTKPVKVRNIKVRQTLPEGISLEQVSSRDSYSILSQEPAALEFNIGDLDPDSVKGFSYVIDGETSELIADIESDVDYDGIRQGDIDDIIGNSTFVSVKSGLDGRKGAITINPKQPLGRTRIYLRVPKCMAAEINKMHFRNSDYEIVSSDPIVLWQLEDMSKDLTVDFEIDSAVSDDCADELQVLAVGEPLDEAKKEGINAIVILLPLFILPLVFIMVINKIYLGKTDGQHKYARLIITLAVLIGLVIVSLPKSSLRGGKLCECFGVQGRGTCYGITHSCFLSPVLSEQYRGEPCLISSCKEAEGYLTDLKGRVGNDLIIVMDRSRSMQEGEMQSAKAALVNLLTRFDEDQRTSIIAFDDKATLVKGFTNDRMELITAINGIDIGNGTEYIPALKLAIDQFRRYGDRRNKWHIIFVSDGNPRDVEGMDAILAEVDSIVSSGICVNTIGFGTEAAPGTMAESALKSMALMSVQVQGCGTYAYSEKEMQSLSETLGDIYETSVKGSSLLRVTPLFDLAPIGPGEDMYVEVSVSGEENQNPVPGMVQGGLCSPAATVSMQIGEDVFPLTNVDDRYTGLIKGRDAGVYPTALTARLSIGADDCGISGIADLGNLTVDETYRFDDCGSDDCSDVNRYITENLSDKSVLIYITDQSYVPQNISAGEGTMIVWQNLGERPHTVTSGIGSYDGLFDSGILYPGESFNYTLKGGGSINYFDNLTAMRGSLANASYIIGNFTLKYKNDIDLVLLVDRSESMAGSNIVNLKNAASSLVQRIYAGDRVAIVRFSDETNIVTDFTDEESVLLSGIESLRPGGGTLYAPGLGKARTLFEERSRPRAGKVLIFLTDGKPWDSSESTIYDEVDSLIDDGVCIYVIGYGEEIVEGSLSEQVLQEIVRRSDAKSSCGAYHYSPSDENRLTKIFGSIYNEAQGKLPGLVLEPHMDRTVILSNESLDVAVKVRSSINRNYLPGKMDGLCSPPAAVTATLSGPSRYLTTLDYEGSTIGYTGSFKSPKPGKYDLEIDAASVCSTGEECSYHGTHTEKIVVVQGDEWRVEPLSLVAVCFVMAALVLLWAGAL